MAELSPKAKQALRFVMGSKGAGQEMVTLFDVTYGTAEANKLVVADATMVTDLGKIQGVTNGVGAASKAVVLNSSSGVSSGIGTFAVSDLAAGGVSTGTLSAAGATALNGDAQVGESDSKVSFFTSATTSKRTSVAITTTGIHAALVAYGLIS